MRTYNKIFIIIMFISLFIAIETYSYADMKSIPVSTTKISLETPFDSRWKISVYAIDILVSVLDSRVLMPILDVNVNISYSMILLKGVNRPIHLITIFLNVGFGYLVTNPAFAIKSAVGIGIYDDLILVGWYVAGYFSDIGRFDTGLFISSKFLRISV